MIRPVVLSIALTVLAACERPAERTEARGLAAKVLDGLLTYPPSHVVSVSAGQDVAQVVLTTPAGVQGVATWYRQMLRLNGWELRSDAVANDGTISIYADSGSRPLWITLKANVGGPGTTYTLIGAVTQDSSQAQRSGSSMSSKRIQRR